MIKLSQPGPITGERYIDEFEHKRNHFYPCSTAGKVVDAGDLRQAIWHDQPRREPLELDS
ncbi:hypothetical protein ABID19_001301 [Mesorhizobium robiniae]|uniref:Uncharacterized protein n=1 Tax=Mesorhizobium robiniae TaxID=559315 RepID=A0ABV2GJ32_9HYPH